jgi:hypothetical protein
MRVETFKKPCLAFTAYLIKKNSKEGGGNGAEKTNRLEGM